MGNRKHKSSIELIRSLLFNTLQAERANWTKRRIRTMALDIEELLKRDKFIEHPPRTVEEIERNIIGNALCNA